MTPEQIQELGGICDGCLETVAELRVYNSQPIAGLCLCRDCAGDAWDHLEPITEGDGPCTDTRYGSES